MGRIHMETEKLHYVADRMRATVNEFFDSYEVLNSRINRLSRDWSGGSAERFSARANGRLRALARTIDRLDALRGQLLREIDQWVEVDQYFGDDLKRKLRHYYWLFGKSPEGQEDVKRIIRDVDVSGKQFLLDGFMRNAGVGGVVGAGMVGVYGSSMFQYKGDMLDLTYEESLALMAMWEQGQLPKDWAKGKKPKLFDGKVTFYEAEKDFGTAQAAVFAGQAGTEAVGYDYSVLSAEASGSASFSLEHDGVKGKVEGKAGAYLGKISGNAGTEFPIGPVTAGVAVAGSAYVGAQVCGEAGFEIDPLAGDMNVKVGGEAFAGGKLEGEAEGSLGYGGVEGTVKASGSLNYGIGAQANADVGIDDGTIKADISFGATLGLGFNVGVDFELDVSDAVTNIMDATGDAVAALFKF